VLTDSEIHALTSSERRELIRRIVDVERLPEQTARTRAYRKVFLRVVFVSAVVLVPWIVFLTLRLPRHYRASHWDLAWAGFDIALAASLALTAWAAWRRRQILIISSVIVGTLLLCDAWFDVLTSHTGNDQMVSVLSAILIEVPLAVLMFATAYRLVSLSARTVNVLFGGSGDVGHLWQMPLVMAQAQRFIGHKLD